MLNSLRYSRSHARDCGEGRDAQNIIVVAAVARRHVWICKQCRDALCVREGIHMPGPALVNLMWGGREHPAFQDISEAASVLLGRGRLVYQKIN